MDVSASTDKYCLLRIVRRWPYLKTPKTSQTALKRYFDKESFFNRPWDIYLSEPFGIVIPFDQVKAFFQQAEAETDIALLKDEADLVLNSNRSIDVVVTFMGTSHNSKDYDKLTASLPMHADTSVANIPPTFRKNTKSQRKRQTQIQNRRSMLDSAVEIVNDAQNYAFFSIDIESWEKNHDLITEIGLTKYFPEKGGWSFGNSDKIISDHIIVKEHRYYKNGTYVADASGNFEFGTSKHVPLAELRDVVASFLASAEHRRLPILIGHDISADIEYLRKLGYKFNPDDFTMVFDTVELWKARADTFDGISLSKLCNGLDITAWNCHNAGNDANYTMKAFLAMAATGRVDRHEIRDDAF